MGHIQRGRLPKSKMASSDDKFMNLSMLSPRGGGARAYVGHTRGGGGTGICGAFDLYCLPHPWESD